MAEKMKFPKAFYQDVVYATALMYKEKFGRAFIVMVGNMPMSAHYDDGAARHSARMYSESHGRERVSVRGTHVPVVKVPK